MRRLKSSVKIILISVVSIVCVAAIVLGCVFGIKNPNNPNNPNGPNNPNQNIHEGLSEEQINFGNLVQESNNKNNFLKNFDNKHLVDNNGNLVEISKINEYYDFGFSVYLDTNKTKEMFYVYPNEADENNYQTINLQTLVGNDFEFEYVTELKVLDNKLVFITHKNSIVELVYLELDENRDVKSQATFEMAKLGEMLFFVHDGVNYRYDSSQFLGDSLYIFSIGYENEGILNSFDVFVYRQDEEVIEHYHTDKNDGSFEDLYLDINHNAITFLFKDKIHIENFYNAERQTFDLEINDDYEYTLNLSSTSIFIKKSKIVSEIVSANTVYNGVEYTDYSYNVFLLKTNELKNLKLEDGYFYAGFSETIEDIGFLALTEYKLTKDNIISNDKVLVYFDENLNKIVSFSSSSSKIAELKGFYGNKFLTSTGIYTIKNSNAAECIFEFFNDNRNFRLNSKLNNNTFVIKDDDNKYYVLNLDGEYCFNVAFNEIESYDDGYYFAEVDEKYYILNVNDKSQTEVEGFLTGEDDKSEWNGIIIFNGYGIYIAKASDDSMSIYNYKGLKIISDIVDYDFSNVNGKSYFKVLLKNGNEKIFYSDKNINIAGYLELTEAQNEEIRKASANSYNVIHTSDPSTPTSEWVDNYGQTYSIAYYGATISTSGKTVTVTYKPGYYPANSIYFHLNDAGWETMVEVAFSVSNKVLTYSVPQNAHSQWTNTSDLKVSISGSNIVVTIGSLNDAAPFKKNCWNEVGYDRLSREYKIIEPTNSTYSSSQSYGTEIASGYTYYRDIYNSSSTTTTFSWSTAPKTLVGGKYYGIYYLSLLNSSIGKSRDYTIASDGKSFSRTNPALGYFCSVSSSKLNFNGPMYYHVTYEPITYTVQYYGVNYSNTTATYDSQFSVSIPTRTGYTFNGWLIKGMDFYTHYYGASSASSSATNTTLTTGSTDRYFKNLRSSSGTVSMTALWTLNTYSISYSLDGGTSGGTQPTTATYNGGNYGFFVNNRGYYESQNTNKHNTYSLAKVSFNTTSSNQTVYFYCRSYGESNYDYGILSNLNTSLSTSNSADSSSLVYKSFKGSSSGSFQTVSYTVPYAGSNYIYIKYIKDGSSNNYDDSFQFYSNLSISVDNIAASSSIYISNPSRTGYTYNGWSVSGMDSTTHYYGTTSSTTSSTSSQGISLSSGYQYFKNLRATGGTVTFTARWTINSYTLFINPNGGNYNGYTSTSSYTQNYNTIKAIYNPTRTGYTFNGWLPSNSYGTLDNLMTSPNNSVINITSYTSAKPIVYNNAGGGTVTHTIISDSSSSTNYSLQIRTNGSASPGAGGFHTAVTVEANSAYYHCFTAKIPVGCTIFPQSNYIGDGAYYEWLTSNEGTGNWETYSYIYHTGTGSGFNSFGIGFINIEAPDNTNLTWYLRDSIIYKKSSSSSSNFTYGAGSNTITAVWSINRYTLIVNPNGGSYNGSTVNTQVTQVYNSGYNLSVPTRTGYTFSYWSLSGYGSLSGSTFTYGAGNSTITANWTPNQYHISLYDRGNLVGQITEYYNTYWSPSSITIPTRTDGFIFNGYYTGENGTGDMIINSSGVVSGNPAQFLEDTSIYLYWYDNQAPNISRVSIVQDENVGFYIYAYINDNVGVEIANLNAYTLVDGNDDLMTYSLEYLSEPHLINSQEYNYSCYVSVADHNYELSTYQIVFDVKDKNSNTNDLQANFVFDFIITIDKQEGSGGTDSFKVSYGQGFSLVKIEKPARHGYIFMGCYTEPEGNGDMIIDINGNIIGRNTFASYHKTIYVRWIEAPYNIVYELNSDYDTASTTGKFLNPDEITYKIKREVPFYVPDPVRIGYTFVGWKISGMNDELPHYFYRDDVEFLFYSTDGIFVNNGNPNNITIQASTFKSLQSGDETVTLTAVWEAVSFNVYYHYLPAEYDGLAGIKGINLVENMIARTSNSIIYDKFFNVLDGAYSLDSLFGAYVPSELELVGWYFVDSELSADIYIDDFAKDPSLYMSYCDAGMEHMFDFYRDHTGSTYNGETKWHVGNIHAYAIYRPVEITVKVKVVKEGGTLNNINDYIDSSIEFKVRLGDKIILPTTDEIGNNAVGFMIAYDNYEGGELTGDGSKTSVTKFTYDGVEYEAKCNTEIRWGYPGSSAHNDPRNPVYYLYAVYAV